MDFSTWKGRKLFGQRHLEFLGGAAMLLVIVNLAAKHDLMRKQAGHFASQAPWPSVRFMVNKPPERCWAFGTKAEGSTTAHRGAKELSQLVRQ
mmetsp:Transcript_9740/g.27853  ORF Transcript_9740/g.27853 Transcript_9740/m.27853 type:complete len:93 (-) Transcript_9740:435-713(-)